MRKETNTGMEEFDLMVASALSEAEVKAPRRVRRAVLAATAPAKEPAGAAWLWAAVAFACVAASVLWLRIPSEKNFQTAPGVEILASRQPLSEGRALLAAIPDAELRIPASPDGFRPSGVPSPAASLEPAATTAAPAFPETGTTVGKEQADGAGDGNATAENTAAEDDRRLVPIDLWADTEAEDFGARSRADSRLSIVAGGSAASQESRFAAGYDTPMYASGYTAAGVQEDTKSNFGIPVSANAGIRYHITERMSIGAALSWTMLSREFDGKYKTSEGRFTNTLQYVGVPVSVYYDIIRSRSTLFYAFGSAMAEKCISNSYFLRTESNSPIVKEKVAGMQYGLAAGLGVGFRLADNLWLCLDPGITWWLDSAQPKSVRTENPFSASFSLGLKFDL